MEKIDFSTVYYSDDEIASFYLVLNELMKEFGCSYLGYVFEDLKIKKRVGFSSNPDWQSEFVGNHLIDSCHLWKTVVNQFVERKQSTFILPWDTVKPKTSLEKDILLFRGDHYIGENGISFCTQKNNSREYLAFAPEKNDPEFVKYVSKNINLIKCKVNIFRMATKSSLYMKENTNEYYS